MEDAAAALLKAHGNIADIARKDRRENAVQGMYAILLSQETTAKSQNHKKTGRSGGALSGLVGEVLRGGG
jgi:hypothetical protein